MIRPVACLIVGMVSCFSATASLPLAGRGIAAMSAPVVDAQPGTHITNIADLVENLSRMSKPEREKILSSMPDKPRQNIERGLEHLDALSPVRRQRALERFRLFTMLETSQKDEIRGAIFRYRKLPERRQEILQNEMDALQDMPNAQREHFIASEEFKLRFSADERSILEELRAVMPRQ